MPEAQATAEHEGLNILSLDFTFSRGSHPSVCWVEAIPLPSFTGSVGPLTLKYGDDTRVFPGCALDYSDLRIEKGRKCNLRILDRRWQWQWQIATYRANVPGENSEPRSDTKRTPRQIAEFLLTTLGETGYDVSGMPTNVFPFVLWDGVKVSDALDELCLLTGCVLTLDADDKVRIKKIGEGKAVPDGAFRLNEVYDVLPAVVAKQIELRTGELLVQSKLALRAITTEFSGSAATLAGVSYRPTNGWEYETPYAFYNVGTLFQDRDRNIQYGSTYALQNVWRVFHVWEQAQGGYAVPGVSDSITSMEQLGLRDTLNDFALDANGVKRALPAYVEGTFWPGSDNYANVPAGTRVHTPFTIDSERGYVIFDEPVFALASDYTHANPVLWLTTSYTVLPRLTSTPNRYRRYRDLDPDGEGTYGVERRDLLPRITQRYANVTSPDYRLSNLGVIDAVAKAQLDAVENSLKPQPAQDAYYGGWDLRTDLDGMLAQITWTMGGAKKTRTRISRWHQHAPTLGVRHAVT